MPGRLLLLLPLPPLQLPPLLLALRWRLLACLLPALLRLRRRIWSRLLLLLLLLLLQLHHVQHPGRVHWLHVQPAIQLIHELLLQGARVALQAQRGAAGRRGRRQPRHQLPS